MTTSTYEFRWAGRLTDSARKAFGDLRIAETQSGAPPTGTVTDQARGRDEVPVQDSFFALPDLTAGSWTPAHSEAARFLGGCVAGGALLGFVTELTRPVWGQRHG